MSDKPITTVKTVRSFTCAECGQQINVNAARLDDAIDYIRTRGWSVSRDRKISHCPTHAPFHRYVGKNGDQRSSIQERISGI